MPEENIQPGEDGALRLTLQKGDGFALEPELGELTSLSLTYASSNSACVSVSASGILHAARSGRAIVTVTAYNGAKASVEVTVLRWTDMVPSITVAHAMGGVDGQNYTNSLEAFEYNYARGYRVFECDLVWTADGGLVLWHDWSANQINADTPKGYVPTLEEFKSMKIAGKYTPLDFSDLLALTEKYPDAQLLLDCKNMYSAQSVTELSEKIVGVAKAEEKTAQLDKMIMPVGSPAQFEAAKKVYPFKRYLYSYYMLNRSKPSTSLLTRIAKYCHENGIDAIAMNYKYWDKKFYAIQNRYDVSIGLYTVNSQATASKLLNAGARFVITDFLSAQ